MEPTTRDETGRRHFLVELSSPDGGWTDLSGVTARARRAAADARTGGADIVFVRSVYAPESEALFLVYRAATAEQVFAAAAQASLAPTAVSVALNAVDGGGR